MSRIYKSAVGERAVREAYADYLKRWPVPSQQLRIPTREGETLVVASGSENAPPLLLFHGSGSNAAIWMSNIAAWAAHFRVFAIDMIGEPGLSAPSRPPLASDAYALWMQELLAALSVTRASVVGVSLGGWLALELATHRPERVESLVLLCPSGVGRQKSGYLFKLIPLLLLGDWGACKARAMVLGRTLAEMPATAREFMELVSMIHRNFRPRMEKVPVFSDDALKRLTMPVMAFVGGKDVLLDSAETRDRLERNAAQAEIHYLAETGHLIPDQTATILDFLLRSRSV